MLGVLLNVYEKIKKHMKMGGPGLYWPAAL